MSSLLVFSLLLVLFAVSFASKEPFDYPVDPLFVPNKNGNIPSKKCINIGSRLDSWGPYRKEGTTVFYYGTHPSIITRQYRKINGTQYNRAFSTQRSRRFIVFYVRLPVPWTFRVLFGFANLDDKCAPVKLTANQVSSGKKIDICTGFPKNQVHFERLENVKPNRIGLVKVRVLADKGKLARLAVICFTRTNRGSSPSTSPSPVSGVSSSPSSIPTPTPTPTPTSTSSSSPSLSSTPAPSSTSTASATPTPTPTPTSSTTSTASATPTPTASTTSTSTATATPTPTPTSTSTATATPTPSVSPTPAFSKSVCPADGCDIYEGRVGYKVIGNSLSYDEDRQDCRIRDSASAQLTIPGGAKIVSAMLYWSASGDIRKRGGVARAQVNGVNVAVSGSNVERDGYSEYIFYGARMEIKDKLRSLTAHSQTVTVGHIWAELGGQICHGNAAYAAWTLAVVYEEKSLAKNYRVHVCTNGHFNPFTFPAGDYYWKIKCTSAGRNTKFAKTTVATFESDNYKGEHFYIGGNYLGHNLFHGSTAPNLDIKTFPVTSVVSKGYSTLEYHLKTYLVYTVWGRAVEGLFMPVKVLQYEH